MEDQPTAQRLQFFLGLLLGLTLTSVGATFVAWWSGAEAFWKHETIIAGLLAITGGSIPVYFIYRQILVTVQIACDQNDQQDRVRTSLSIRSRALLHQPLVQVNDYVKACVDVVQGVYPLSSGTMSSPARCLDPEIPLPSLPLEAIAIIAEAIGNVDAQPAKRLATILSKLQVQASRTAGAMDAIYGRGHHRLVFITELDEYLIDAVEILAFVSCVFPFARFDCDEILEPDADRLCSEARQAHISETRHSQVFVKIRRRWQCPV